MCKRILFFGILLTTCAMLWAGASREANESHEGEDPAGIKDSIDINEKKTGKWNFYFEATDKAGNTSRAGPDNIYIDPESDLPRANIINPISNMHVQENLNIVGIAFDDDGIEFTELTVTRNTDGLEMVHERAEGTDYWSYMLNTADTERWLDGEYIVTAWSTDINGLSGRSEDFKPKQHKRHDVRWHLDRKKPNTIVTSHEAGALVAGKITLKGTVYDGNGVQYMGYSTDNGKSYMPVRAVLDKSPDTPAGTYTWEVTFNTNVFEDGPAVVWFEAQDGQGTFGDAAHLLFANNTPPDVQLVYPLAEETVNGVFTISGYAAHPVGMSSVTWKAGGLSGEFPLIIGNPWWSTEVDLRGQKITNVDVEIRAEDVSGNVTTVKRRYKVDQNADLPIVTLEAPLAAAVLSGTEVAVIGAATDDDGVASVLYSINGGDAVEIPTPGYFQFIIPDMPGGINLLEVWARDITGVDGPKVQVKNIAVSYPPPEPALDSFVTGYGKLAIFYPFYTGMTLWLEPKTRTVLELTVKAQALASASITFGNYAPVQIKPLGKDGLLSATVPFPLDMPTGRCVITLTVTDREGRTASLVDYIYIEQTDPFIPAQYAAPRFDWVRPDILGDGRILLSREPLMGITSEVPLNAVIKGPGAENFTVRVDDYDRVLLFVLNEGSFGPLTVTVETADGEIESAPFNVIADFEGPKVAIVGAPPNGWAQTKVPIFVNVEGVNNVLSADYSMDMGATWINLATNLGAKVNTNFPLTLDISGYPDGAVNMLFRAANDVGRVTTTTLTIFKDTEAPQASLIVPVADASVNGIIRMGFAVRETGKLASVRYHRPAGRGKQELNKVIFNVDEWDKDYAPMFIETVMDIIEMPLDENMRFYFEDSAGNAGTVDLRMYLEDDGGEIVELEAWPFTIDQEMDIPVLYAMLPLENEIITTDFIVSGIMFDDDEIARVYWHIDNGDDQVVEAKYGFYIPVSLSSLTDNEHSVTLVAEDIYGVKCEPVICNFRVSLLEPEAAVTFPLYDTVLRDVIEISGTAFDRNEIDRLYVSVDNRNTFNLAYGTNEWKYSFNSKILRDGAHVVFIRVFDKYGISATYATMINVDNTPPEITLDSPGDGSISVGDVAVMGRTLDPNLANVTMELRSLQGVTIPVALGKRDLGDAEVIKEALDIAGLSDGVYNIEIVGTDKAGNFTRVSRNVELARKSMQNFVEIFYPLDNENVRGVFNLYGFAGGIDAPGMATITINDADAITVEVDKYGYFRFTLDSEYLYEGFNTITVYSDFGGDTPVRSGTHHVDYRADGPWITIDNFSFGDFAFQRPWLYGRAGYALTAEDYEILADKGGDKMEKARIRELALDYTEISFDNGRTFTKAPPAAFVKDADYRCRLETGEMREGMHYILVRATMKNGETAVTRMLVQVDKTPPVIRLISPEVGGRYNQFLAYSASATDDVELVSMTYHLRWGDKFFYGVPGFLQGLYVEGIIPPIIRYAANNAPMIFGGGATFFDLGAGLSFFGDNVKIQMQYGMINQKIYEKMGGRGPLRYGGSVFGFKLLAGIYSLPFGSFAGPNWEWLSATLSLGANFSLFDIGHQGYTQSGKASWMSALLAQIEFPRVSLPNRKNLRTFSMFTEGQLWFVPTDVSAEAFGINIIIPHVVLGARLYIF